MHLFAGIAAEGSVDRPPGSSRQHGSEDQPQSRLIDLLLYGRSPRDTDLGIEDKAGDWLEEVVAELDREAPGTVH